MFLKSITIQGFKSFAKKVVIDLSSEVTGVVGPNGSGKSNVAEAIRFVLGEQSMKGLRSKSGSDLIFKGSPHLSALSRASVSITLDNTEKKINQKLISSSSQMSETLLNFINLDEIVLTREIYADGQSEFSINDTKVRLKDVQEILALAQISAAGHTIINQGEADKILLSNNKERREILEEALGLRIYHMRIKESEKKLAKVGEHLREIDLKRKENLPHLNFLEKTKQKLENREKEVENISSLLKIYLSKEDAEINKLKSEINSEDFDFDLIQKYKNEIEILEKEKIKIQSLNLEIAESHEKLEDKNTEDIKNIKEVESKIEEIKKRLENLNFNYDTDYKEYVNLDLEIKFLEKKKDHQKLFVEENNLNDFKVTQEKIWDEVFSDFVKEKCIEKFENIKINLEELKNSEKKFLINISGDDNIEEILNLKNNLKNKKENIDKLKLEKNLLESNLEKLLTEKRDFENKLEMSIEREKIKEENFKKEIENKNKENAFEIENKILSLKLLIQKMESTLATLEMKKENLKIKENNFENILNEMRVLIGISVLNYKNIEEMNDVKNQELLNLSQFELSRKIERSKIKIEETGVSNAGEIIEEYNTLKERDEFLNKEIEDLTKSKISLSELINDLQNTLLTDFNEGLKIINDNFNNYFSEIFEGGKAGLILEKIEEKKSNELDSEENENEDEDEEKISGIEISVSLPQKKVKDLQMLSGGERALTSIALIFAMSSINHPPFMVLDETDAALDEANARKYGKMIQKLSERSKLLVITHNRETMNRCDVLYGVTVGAEGSSKLLSIKFEEATEYAK